MIIPFFFKNAPRNHRENNIPPSGTNHLNSTHFLRFTLSHHSMMIPASVLLPGALLLFGEPLPEGFLCHSPSRRCGISARNAGEEPARLCLTALPRIFLLVHAYRPDGFPAQASFSCVSEALPVSFSDSSLPLGFGFRPRRSPASDQDGNCRRLRSSSAMPSFLPVSCHERLYLIQFSD